jgi:hypothetical protein
MFRRSMCLLLSTTCATIALAGSASAQQARVRAPGDTIIREESVPDTGLIVGGTVLLGTTYATSLIVAATSDYEPDDHLAVPLAGPWLNLADRGDCGVENSPSCTVENTNRVLLVADGILQGVGALQILGGFLFPAKRTVVESARPSIHVTPQLGSTQVGLTATGTF